MGGIYTFKAGDGAYAAEMGEDGMVNLNKFYKHAYPDLEPARFAGIAKWLKRRSHGWRCVNKHNYMVDIETMEAWISESLANRASRPKPTDFDIRPDSWLGQRVSMLSDVVPKIADGLGFLSRRVNEIDDRVRKVEADMESLRDGIAEVDVDRDGDKARIDRLEDMVAKLQGRLDEAERHGGGTGRGRGRWRPW